MRFVRFLLAVFLVTTSIRTPTMQKAGVYPERIEMSRRAPCTRRQDLPRQNEGWQQFSYYSLLWGW